MNVVFTLLVLSFLFYFFFYFVSSCHCCYRVLLLEYIYTLFFLAQNRIPQKRHILSLMDLKINIRLNTMKHIVSPCREFSEDKKKIDWDWVVLTGSYKLEWCLKTEVEQIQPHIWDYGEVINGRDIFPIFFSGVSLNSLLKLIKR